MQKRRLISVAVAAVAFVSLARAEGLVDRVDPFIGTAPWGNVYPGPALPWGFLQVGPDTGYGSWASGYRFDRKINGFSQQRVSGVGAPIYGELSLLPIVGDVGDPTALTSTGKSDEQASVGYYAVTLEPWKTRVELTVSDKVALQRHTFPADAAGHVVIDVAHCLYGRDPSQGGGWMSSYPVKGNATVSEDGREVFGQMTYKGGRSTSEPWTIYFVIRLDRAPATVGVWDDARKVTGGVKAASGKNVGVVLDYAAGQGPQTVASETAVSWRSVEQARGYLDAHASWDFEKVRADAARNWEAKLGKIVIADGAKDDLTRFYTALYRAHLAPNDWTGESPKRYGDLDYFENQLCMWDQFRTVFPLMTLIEPAEQSRIVNSIINYYKTDGWTGDSRSAHQFEHVQNGSSADVILADAFVKNLPGINWADAYAAARKNAFVDANPAAVTRPKNGRYRLDEYRRLGYLPADLPGRETPQTVSRTLEYVYNDACVLTLARKYGSAEDLKALEARAGWYRNLWDAGTGFMRGKTAAGAWFEPFDPAKVETGKQYYEGHAWTWTWYVPHDVQGLIDLFGGDAPFVAKLTTACEKYYEAYNEPCMLEAYLFIHAGRPDLTQRFARVAIKNFTTAKNGLPGNDDSGTTSAWLVWTMLGLYPNAGQPFYYIGSPTFASAKLSLAGDKTFTVLAPETSATNIYVQSATLDGQPLDRAWLTHDEIAAGGELVLTMGDKPSQWARAGERPPSLSLAK